MNSIKQGVKDGDFCIGYLDSNNKPICKHYKESVLGDYYGIDIIIQKEICEKQKQEEEEAKTSENPEDPETEKEPPQVNDSDGHKKNSQKNTDERREELNTHKQLKLEFDVPQGKISQLMGMMNYIQKNFKRLSIEIKADEGEMTEQEYQDTIKETLRQLGIDNIK